MTRRDPYRDVGEAERHAIALVNRSGCTTLEHRAFLAVLALTASYSRLSDVTYLARVAALTYGIEESRPWQQVKTRKALANLRRLGAIEVEPPRGRPAGRPSYRVALPGNVSGRTARDGADLRTAPTRADQEPQNGPNPGPTTHGPNPGRPGDLDRPETGPSDARPQPVGKAARDRSQKRPGIGNSPSAKSGPIPAPLPRRGNTEGLPEGISEHADRPPGIGSADPTGHGEWWATCTLDGDRLARMIGALAPDDAADLSADLDALAIDKHLARHLTADQREALADLIAPNPPADVRHVLKIARAYTESIGYDLPRLALPKRDTP